MKLVKILMTAEWQQLTSHWIDRLLPLLFFLLAILLFPLGLSSDPGLLKIIAPGMVWILVLFVNILTFHHIWQLEFQEGTLEQYLLSTQPLVMLVYIKILMHWLWTGVPLILISPFISMIFHLNAEESLVLFLSLVFGTPIFSILGTLLSTLTLKLQSTHFLLFLLLVPLLIPILILGVSSVAVVGMGQATQGLLLLLVAINLVSLSVLPSVTGVLLRVMR